MLCPGAYSHSGRYHWDKLSIDVSLGFVDLSLHGLREVLEHCFICVQLIGQHTNAADSMALLTAVGLNREVELLQ